MTPLKRYSDYKQGGGNLSYDQWRFQHEDCDDSSVRPGFVKRLVLVISIICVLILLAILLPR